MSVDNIRSIMTGQYAEHVSPGNPTITAADWTQSFKRYITFTKPIADTAATDYEYPIFHNPWSSTMTVTNVTLIPMAALTASDSNYKTIAVKRRVAAGTATDITSNTTKITGGTGDWVALTPITLTLSTTASDLVVPTLGDLSLSLIHTSSGVAVPVCTVVIEYYFT